MLPKSLFIVAIPSVLIVFKLWWMTTIERPRIYLVNVSNVAQNMRRIQPPNFLLIQLSSTLIRGLSQKIIMTLRIQQCQKPLEETESKVYLVLIMKTYVKAIKRKLKLFVTWIRRFYVQIVYCMKTTRIMRFQPQTKLAKKKSTCQKCH